MNKFFMNGRSGFIGSLIETQMPHDLLIEKNFNSYPDAAFLNLSNISSSCQASMTLLNKNFRKFSPVFKNWIHIGSFSTLQLCEELDASLFNFGAKAPLRDAYTQGKLAQEYYLLEQFKRGLIDSLTFFYLPAVIDPGGSWDRTIRRAKANGYILPPVSSQARFNHIFVSDLIERLRSLEFKPGLRRFIVNRSDSAQTAWACALGPNQVDPRSQPYVDRCKSLRRIVTANLLARRRGLMPVSYTGSLSAELPQRQPSIDPIEESSVLQFYGVMRWLIRFQPYISSH